MDGMKEKKSSNAVKFIIPAVVGAALALILLIVAVATGSLGKNPRKTLANAVDKTFTLSGDALQEIWQTDEYADMFKDEQMHIDADIDLSGLGTMEIQIDKDKERYGMLMDIGYYGISLFEANLYMDEEEMRLGIPEAIDYVLYVDFETFDEDIETFIENYDLNDDAADGLRALGKELQNMGAADDAEGAETMEEANEQFRDALRSMCTGAKYTETGSKNLTVNDRERKCKGYVVTIADTKIAEFLSNYKEIYESNKAFRDYLNRLMTSSMGFEVDSELVLEAFDVLSDECLEAGDFQIYFYVYDGVLAQVFFEYGEIFFEWNICGGNFPLENMDLTLAYDSDEFVIKRSGSLDGADYEAEYQLSENGEDLILTIELDKEDDDFRIELEDDYYFSMLLKGKIEKTVPGSEYEIIIDTFKVDDEERLYGNITVSNECEEIEVPEGDLRNLLKMKEDDWYDLMRELYRYFF
ncbi:MAG: hypothetical protein K2N15_15100 [Lachnospiraceae bacterium]|nr:hypothetical protein [Lachnospiraceae bacterium]